MTIKEAIEYWKFKYNRAKNFTDIHWEASERRGHEEYVEALKVAVITLEKQIPRKVKRCEKKNADFLVQGYLAEGRVLKWVECPQCGNRLQIRHNFCPSCGQTIDWSREND